jgi:hypothetical protein
MCGSQDVALVVETPPTQPPAPPLPVPSDAFADFFGPLFERALGYVRARDEQRAERLEALDEADNDRRQSVSRALVDLCDSLAGTAAALTDTAKAGTAWLRQQTPTVRDGGAQ